MTTQSQTQPAVFNATRFLPILLILFAGSGCSALIYEIVWFQLLQLAIGSTRRVAWAFCWPRSWAACASAASRFRAFKLGWLASLADLRRAGSRHRRLRIPGAVCLPFLDRIYIAGARERPAGHVDARIAVPLICLLPPTILMGASLPAIVRWIESTPRGVSWWGLLYGGQHGGRGLRMPARGLLSAAHL